MNTHLTDYLEYNAQKFPQKVALDVGKDSLTWKELAEQVSFRASAIQSKLPGSTTQKIIALLLPNGIEFVITYLAIVKTGHILMPLDPSFKTLEISSIIDQLPPALTITNQELSSLFPQDHQTTLANELQGTSSEEFLRLPAKEQIATLLFTSGTTGKPKATPYTHANHLWNIKAVTDLWEWTSDDTIATSLPLSHWHGLVMCVAGMLYHGNILYLQERFTPDETLELLSSGKVSLFMHVPIAYHRLVHSNLEDKYDISPVRLCISGSSYLPPKVWESFHKLYGHKILERYGASETGLVASNLLTERIPGEVGFPLQEVEIKLSPEGELLMKSPGLFPGYYNNPEATAKNMEDGWWHTSDIGEIDKNGRIQLKGRLQEKIKHFGYTLYPRDLEWTLLQNSDIEDAVALAIQGDELSDTLVYFVISHLTVKEIASYCKEHLPYYWRPDEIIILEDIPRTRSGKPRLAELKKLVSI